MTNTVPIASPPLSPGESLVYVGTYSVRGSVGIYAVAVDAARAALRIVGTTEAHNPSFLAWSPGRSALYAASEVEPTGGPSYVAAYHADPSTGALAPLGEERSTEGLATCHLAVAGGGRWLLTSNYGDGSHSLLPIDAGGALGPVARRVANSGPPGPGQSGGHAHSAAVDVEGDLAYGCDLGLDRVIAYRLDAARGELREIDGGGASLAPGSGPRHLAAHPRLPTLYVANELNATVAVLRRDPDRPERLTLAQTAPTLPPEYMGVNACADIHLSPAGDWLYVSNRGHDSIAAYAVRPHDGTLALAGFGSTQGRWPRNFAVLSTGELLVANQESDDLHLLRPDAAGVPRPIGASLSIPAPVCVLPR